MTHWLNLISRLGTARARGVYGGCVLALGLALGLAMPTVGQLAAPRAFEVLRLPPSARVAMLGGRNVSLPDRDAALAGQNPALLNDSMVNRPALSVSRLLGGLTFASAAFTGRWSKANALWHAGIVSLNYGTINGTNAVGNATGAFTPFELVAYGGVSSHIGRLHYGMNVKWAYAAFDINRAHGLGVDVGFRYSLPRHQLTIGLALRNLGAQLGRYGSTGLTYAMPVSVELGLTQKLAHAPIRYSITLSDLQRWQMRSVSDATRNASFAESLVRHLTVAVELLPVRSVVVAVAYNHNRRAELVSADQGFGLAGFALGFGLRLRRFNLDYAYSGYHASGGANLVGVSFLLTPERR